MTYNEFQKMLTEHLTSTITKASEAGAQTGDQVEQAIYRGVIRQAQDTLRLIHSSFVIDNRIPISPIEFDILIKSVDDDELRRKLQSLKG